MSVYTSVTLPLSPRKVIKKVLSSRTLPLIVILFIVGGWAILGTIIIAQHSQNPYLPPLSLLMGVIAFILLLIIAGSIIYQYYYYKLYYYDFRDEDAEIRKGVVSRATGHIRYDRLQNVYVDQDVLDRILGLYDVHYETAGEKSGFYSHVDGLIKENADKLVQFLVEKSKSGDASQASVPQSTSGTPPAPSGAMNTVTLSTSTMPLSPRVVAHNTLGMTILFGIVAGFIAYFKHNPGSLVFVLPILIIVSWIYSYVWYKNFYFEFGAERGQIRSKVIAQTISYVNYDRIQNINVRQGILARLFGLSMITIETAGERSGMMLSVSGLTQKDAEQLRDFLLAKAQQYHKAL